MVILNSFLNVVGPQAWLDGFTVTGGTKGGMENSFSSPTVNNCTFISNQNTSTSAAAAMQNSVCSSAITNCKFISNKGAAAVMNSGFGAFSPNNGVGPTFSKCVFSGNLGVNAGGVSNSGCIVTYTDCDFNGNKSSINGGAMSSTQALVNITNCVFSNNEATQRGGGIFQDKCVSNITTSSFTGNLAEYGGGIANQSDTFIRYMDLSHCTFDGNHVNLPSTGTERLGGGVFNRAKANISYCVFRNNTAGYNNMGAAGGGLGEVSRNAAIESAK